MATRRIYSFGGGKAEGNKDMKELLGGKGAGLAEMSNIGIPVPPGFTITTEVCGEYYRAGKKLPRGLDVELRAALKKVEALTGKGFGDPANPLLVSVRSGARVSMPGMMDTVLNLGLNDATVEGLAVRSKNPRFAWDSYRRFVAMFGDVVLDMKPESKEDIDPFEEILHAKKQARHGSGVALRNHRNVGLSLGPKYSPVAFHFRRRAKCFRVVVGELDCREPLRVRYLADQADRVEAGAAHGIAAAKVIGQQGAPAGTRAHVRSADRRRGLAARLSVHCATVSRRLKRMDNV